MAPVVDADGDAFSSIRWAAYGVKMHMSEERSGRPCATSISITLTLTLLLRPPAILRRVQNKTPSRVVVGHPVRVVVGPVRARAVSHTCSVSKESTLVLVDSDDHRVTASGCRIVRIGTAVVFIAKRESGGTL